MPILPDMYPCKPDIFEATYSPAELAAGQATAAPAQPAAQQGAAYADAHGAIMGAAYDFRDAHISGSPNQKRSAHAALESAVTHALRAARASADSVQEDAARYRWLREQSSTLFVNISINGEGAEIAETLDSAVDAARKQGEKQ